ncbi:hypothetical protein NITGR_590011 [Nitrospina gracilis 3/211]|uniref:Uncharacterized protein n=1 Tax=Nitrospina gracilis (strain 3/211) TaxID=1266370 RepID=M1Z083_NITG3|nr:hypothetical protein NITGR_590011 [Nitrospina gracilis 3/211]
MVDSKTENISALTLPEKMKTRRPNRFHRGPRTGSTKGSGSGFTSLIIDFIGFIFLTIIRLTVNLQGRLQN